MQVPREGLVQKLQRLSSSQQSIESVSSFCIFYHKDARGVVQIWDQEFYKANPERRLALLFLANHILQEGRKKGMSFQEEFFKVLPKALGFVSKSSDDKTKRQLGRLVTVWEERRVFGNKHIKSFRDVVGGGAGGRDPSTKAGNPSSDAAVAAAAGTASAASDLGPVGDALAKAMTCTALSASQSKEFNSSWSQATLATSGLQEVTAACTQLAAYTSALQEELTARQAALIALAAETARQNAEVSRINSQLSAAGGQRQQLEQQMLTLTQQMTSALAGLSQNMQQQNGTSAGGGAAASSPPAAAHAPVGSPEPPELLLEDDDDDTDAGGPPALPHVPVVAPSVSTAAAAAAAPGTNGGPLGGFLQQPLQPQQDAQPQVQQQSQPQPAPLSGSLQALLGNPEMLSAAILGGAGAVGASGDISSASAAPSGPVGGGMQLQLQPQVGFNDSGNVFGRNGGEMNSFEGFGDLPGTFSAGFGSMVGLEQPAAGFADEGDDPYDPLEG